MGMSIVGLYNYDDTILNPLLDQLPSVKKFPGYYPDMFVDAVDIDRDVVTMEVLTECAEMDLIYTDLDFFRIALHSWAKKESRIWQSMYESEFFRYNPLWNKDGETGYTDVGTSGTTRSVTSNGDSTASGTDGRTASGQSHTHGNEITNQSVTDSKTGFDSASLQTTGSTQTETTRLPDITEDSSGTESGEWSETRGNKNVDNIVDKGDNSKSGTTWEHGNIGVTKSTELINDYRVTANFSTIDFIVRDFAKKFCVQTY